MDGYELLQDSKVITGKLILFLYLPTFGKTIFSKECLGFFQLLYEIRSLTVVRHIVNYSNVGLSLFLLVCV